MKLAHIGLHKPGNAGDTMLFVAVRQLLESKIGNVEWDLLEVHKEVDSGTVERLNMADGVIIGGGGLFLKDTNANINSGWQWNCPNWMLRKIEVPIIVFAVGYNRFRGQDEFGTCFKRNFNVLHKKAGFFGVRNSGSLQKLTEYLRWQKSKIVVQPCPTTIYGKINPTIIRAKNTMQRLGRIALNMAYDRPKYRYGERYSHVENEIAEMARWIVDNGYRLEVVCHCGNDASIIPILDSREIEFTRINLDFENYRKVYAYYINIDLAIGARGHSQMIPFGIETPILSIISHNKLAYFLEDIGHPEWGIDITNPGLALGMITKIQYIFKNYDRVVGEIQEAQEKLWRSTQINLNQIKAVLNGG